MARLQVQAAAGDGEALTDLATKVGVVLLSRKARGRPREIPLSEHQPRRRALRELGSHSAPHRLLQMRHRCLPEWEPNQRVQSTSDGWQTRLEPRTAGPGTPRTPKAAHERAPGPALSKQSSQQGPSPQSPASQRP